VGGFFTLALLQNKAAEVKKIMSIKMVYQKIKMANFFKV